MHRWERRLKDLAHLLGNCVETYFEPNLFRLNTNQFLTTARTVTFLIQKDKATIPEFDAWYRKNVLEPWSSDPVMNWAKDSRNHIEKEGDLDVHSTMSAKLFFSYLEEEDITIPCPNAELLRANVKRLLRFASQVLPSGVANEAVVQIERRWVANLLPTHELSNALLYVYARVYDVCVALARHLEFKLSESVPDPTAFDERLTGRGRVVYVKYKERALSSMRATRMGRDPDYKPPPAISEIVESKDQFQRHSLQENVNFAARFAEATFRQDGHHVPMLLLFDDDWRTIDFVGFQPDDQATKYMFWRSIAERMIYLRAKALIWIAEYWIRDLSRYKPSIRIASLPIQGEFLAVAGLDYRGELCVKSWEIRREPADAKPVLIQTPRSADVWKERFPTFLIPAKRAFEQLAG